MPLLAAFSLHLSGKKVFRRLIFLFFLFLSIGLGALTGLVVVYKSDLPQVHTLEDYHPNVITELYSDDGRVIGSFALERRIIVPYEALPRLLQDALIATEDQRFEKHFGIDIRGIARAVFRGMTSGKRVQGTSTLTQQLSRLCFLTPERSFKRKFQELLIALQIERFYTKPQIMTMYCNQLYLGHGTYGFEAAAQYYFSKTLKDLTLAETATLAGLPAIVHLYTPVTSPEKILLRRDHVLDRMETEKKISREAAEKARQSPINLKISPWQNDLAPYFVEEVRKYLERKYGTQAVHEKGLRVYTTLNIELQQAANEAIKKGLELYDRRHGWRGGKPNILDRGQGILESFEHEDWKKPPQAGKVMTGLVMAVGPAAGQLRFGSYRALLDASVIGWTGKKSPLNLFKPGDLVSFTVQAVDEGKKQLKVELYQHPLLQGALVAIDATTGEVKALVGGSEFRETKFNRATQALRQTGSCFKPIIYTMAIDQGMKPSDAIVDSPISFSAGSGGIWAPHNYDEKFEGAITLRRALAQSRNIPAVKLLNRFGVPKGIEYARKFGITSPNLPPYLPLALGAGEVTLMEMTSAFSTFPNEGIRILPRLIKTVTDYSGAIKEENMVEVREVVSQDTAHSMVELLRGVVEMGTAQTAKVLRRPIAGKTGTTNDFTDAWFIGFTPKLTCGVWVGLDQKKSLGKGETGARAALPIWIDFMQTALKDRPIEEFPGVVLPGPPPAGKVDTSDSAAGDGETPPESPAPQTLLPSPGRPPTPPANSPKPVSR
jgi:penicillin-binding protein 1A